MSADANTTNSSFTLKSILEKDKLKNSNFMDWYRNLRIVLTADNKLYVLETPIPEEHVNATSAARKAYDKHVDDSVKVSCLMLASMIPELQKSLEHMKAYEMIQHLLEMFQQHSRHERFEVIRSLLGCHMQEGSSVSTHVLKMKGFIDHLARLDCPLTNELAGDIILNSLPKSYDQFTLNYNMNACNKTIPELHMMLKTAEMNIPGSNKAGSVLMIKGGPVEKSNGKGKKSMKGKGKGKGKSKVVAKTKPLKDAKCFHCDETGHWRRSYPYLTETKQKKGSTASTSCIFVMEIFSFSSKSWVFDTGCGSHICNDLQGLRKVRKLKIGDLELHVGNGQKVAVKAVGEYVLLLPNGLELVLNNVCFIPSLTRNIVSVSALCEHGFKYAFNDNGYFSAYLNGVFYFDAKPHNGIYEIDVHANNEIYNISNKRMKLDFNDTYLWHCRLGHINKNRMKKLQTSRILDSTGSESFDECESCLSGKLTKQPFKGNSQKAKDLLEIIHSNVCGPFRTTARNGERYFVTFTDDFSRYGFALETAARIVNLAPTKKVEKTPYDIWHVNKPNVSYLKVWGCNAYVTRESQDKLDPRGDKVVFVGYPKTVGYYFYNPNENRVFINRRATFLDKELLARGIGENNVDLDEIRES
ncbi:hypothetical protein E3N88_23861 [Mikania micrantha]|uniref:Uncharacterized protein n=1 Tax=Mikania micrantha TaxID=192012 RepID=A0A5N6NG32_9ASTR|nr:hypothetical protein E3N88_23861 [Mikania micrantha]